MVCILPEKRCSAVRGQGGEFGGFTSHWSSLCVRRRKWKTGLLPEDKLEAFERVRVGKVLLALDARDGFLEGRF